MYKKALKFAIEAHKGQTREGTNIPYIAHPIRVSQVFQDDLEKTVAVLHDIVEDTDITLQDLEIEFYHYKDSFILTNVIDHLSRRKDEKYFDYIERLCANELAIKIKIADVVDNLSDRSCEQEDSMIDRYNKTLIKLSE